MDEAESKEMRRLFLITGSVSIVLPLLALVLVVVFPSLSEHFQHLNTMNDFTGRNLDICDFIFLGGFVVWFFALGWSWLIFDDFVQDWQARKRHRTYI
jgi:type II secretory pathway component PulF